MRFELVATGDERASRRISRMARRSRRTRPALDDMVGVLLDAETRHFKAGARRWTKLTPGSIARKRRDRNPRVRANARRTLRGRGVLERALTERGAPGQYVRFTRDELVFGLQRGQGAAYYGRFHQGGKGVPKRIVLPKPNARTRRGLADVMRHHLTS